MIKNFHEELLVQALKGASPYSPAIEMAGSGVCGLEFFEQIRLLYIAYKDLKNKEIVICSAIKLPDGRIIRGHRHCHCIDVASALINHRHSIGLDKEPWSCDMVRDQGFMTSRNRYVGREEGLHLQLAAGIESVGGGYRHPNLFSEDLY